MKTPRPTYRFLVILMERISTTYRLCSQNHCLAKHPPNRKKNVKKHRFWILKVNETLSKLNSVNLLCLSLAAWTPIARISQAPRISGVACLFVGDVNLSSQKNIQYPMLGTIWIAFTAFLKFKKGLREHFVWARAFIVLLENHAKSNLGEYINIL